MVRHLLFRALYWIAVARIRYWTPIVAGQRRIVGHPHPADAQRLRNAIIARGVWLRKSEEAWK